MLLARIRCWFNAFIPLIAAAPLMCSVASTGLLGGPEASEQELLRVARDMADGLAHLHAHGDRSSCDISTLRSRVCLLLFCHLCSLLSLNAGIVHRDLAARNMLVDTHDRILISDFGPFLLPVSIILAWDFPIDHLLISCVLLWFRFVASRRF